MMFPFLSRVARATTLVAGLSLPCMPLQAQGEYQITNIQRASEGTWTFSMLFRNTQGFGAANSISIGSLTVRWNGRGCRNIVGTPDSCFLYNPTELREGSVQDTRFDLQGVRYAPIGRYWGVTTSCVVVATKERCHNRAIRGDMAFWAVAFRTLV
jgi:hypothetical protein